MSNESTTKPASEDGSPRSAVALGSAAWLRAEADHAEEMLDALGALDDEGERETKRFILGLRDAATQADDLIALVKRMIIALRKQDRTNAMAYHAADYLTRNRLDGSPFRSSPNAEISHARERRTDESKP
jgi:hypothetical protein